MDLLQERPMKAIEQTATDRRRRFWDSRRILAPLSISPAILYIVALVGFPFVLAILYSLSSATTGNPTLHLVGLRNFRNIIHDPIFIRALQNTFLFTFASQALVVVLSSILAIALSKDFFGKRVVRFLILLPWTAPISLGAIGWLWIFDSVFSPIDWTLHALGLLGTPGATFGVDSNIYWLGRPALAMIAVILIQAWRILPLATVIMLAGISAIPKEILDAAEVDGAGFWRRLFQIEIPLLLPIISIAVLFGVVFTFTDMTVVYVLTRGGPINSTQMLASWAFFVGIEAGDLGQGAAVALFLFPVLAAGVALVLRLARRTEVT
jgi:multiple sugar transport system permease protein